MISNKQKVLMRRLFITCFFLVGILGCLFLLVSTHEEAISEDLMLEEAFKRWEEGVEVELQAGKSYITGPEAERKYLADQVAKAPKFFAEKLKKNMFVVVILDASELGKEHTKRLTEITGVQDRQRMWENILEDLTLE